jgi:hydrogenase nickel incorporation protein HypB
VQQHQVLQRPAGQRDGACLLPYVQFDTARHAADVKQFSPGAQLLQVSAVTGEGMADWYDWLGLRLSGQPG